MSAMNAEQIVALQTVLSGKNVFLTGPPGTGKSYTLKAIIQQLKEKQIKYAITASTGCSAVLINGQTIHSYLGMGNGTFKIDKIVDSLKSKKAKWKQIAELQLLIIDEVSMIDNNTFELISHILQRVRVSEEVFGGIQLLLVGDFCQLPPVQGNYCFTSPLWNKIDMQTIQLTQSMRQKNDEEFQQILAEVRFGKCSKKIFERLQKLKDTSFHTILPTKLYSLVADVQAINNHMFKKVITAKYKDAKTIQCFPIVEDFTDIVSKTYYDDDKYIFKYNALSNDKYAKLDDYVIILTKGLQVMVTRNINFESGLINGTTGIVTSLTETSVCIQDAYGKKHIIHYHTDKNENNQTHIRFMPIKLAYAMSIHKSQGATLDTIEVDGSTFIFAPGQLYTALSRAKNLASIKLLNLDKDSFMCHQSVKEFYNTV
jgi:ATP-dependent DNA helicase PIF1